MNGRLPIRIFWFSMAALWLFAPTDLSAQTTVSSSSLLPESMGGPEQWTSPDGLSNTIKVMLLMTVVSLAPAILLMTTSFVRILIVLGLLRQALGTQQLPPSQVITSIALFMSALIMTPVWSEVYDQSIKPYTEKQISLEQAWDRGTLPVRRFMAGQIIRTENSEDVFLFLKYMPSEYDPTTDQPYDDYVFYPNQEQSQENGLKNSPKEERVVPLQALLPAFMLSELKTAFLIGFQIYLPFVILDIVVASVTISMGMLMLPPVLISLPFKLLLFVLVDGWRLVVEMLLESFQVLI